MGRIVLPESHATKPSGWTRRTDRGRMYPMRASNIRFLPSKMTEVLVRTLAALPPTRSDTLMLRPVTEARAPLWEVKDDYNVMWMGETVGRSGSRLRH